MKYSSILFFLSVTTLSTHAAPAPASGMNGDGQILYQGQTTPVSFKQGDCIPYFDKNNQRIIEGTAAVFNECYAYLDLMCHDSHPSFGSVRLSSTQMAPIYDISRGGTKAIRCFDPDNESIF